MAITNSSDVSVVLSGGATNFNVNQSLGGAPSSTPVTTGLNNLFDDVSPEETDIGHEDHRCIYFFNDGETPIYSLKLWILEDVEGGATMELGVQSSDETQRMTLDNAAATGGSLTISYNNLNFISHYNSDLGAWAVELQNTLRGLSNGEILSEVNVTAQAIGQDTVIFDIKFSNKDGLKNHPQLLIVENNLVPAEVDVAITTPQEGAPVNTIAVEIGLETTPPGGVQFFAPSQESPIAIPKLDPEDGFPLWVRRVVTPNTLPKERDGFSLRFTAETLNPGDGTGDGTGDV